MTSEQKKEKRKTSDKIITTVLVVVLLSALGVYIYNKFFDGYETNHMEDTVSERTFIEPVLFRENMMDEYEEVLNIMDKTDASYFYVESGDEDSDACYNVYKTSKADIEAELDKTIEDLNDTKVSMFGYRMIEGLLNASYKDDDIKRSGYEKGTSRILWEKYPGKLVMAGSETDESVYKRFCKPFNGDIDTYFLENQLELKCEDYSFTKMGANINEFGFDVEGNDTIERLDSNLYVIGTAKLTTENAIDGFKGNDVIPAKGESRTIKMRCAFDSFDSTGGPYVFYNLFELLPNE